jgi:hypothetical protein
VPTQAIIFPIGADITIQVSPPTPFPGGIATWNVEFQIFAQGFALGGTPIVLKSTALGSIIVHDPVSCIWYVTMNSVDTAALQPGDYQYGMWRTDAGFEGIVVPISPFILTLQPGSP